MIKCRGDVVMCTMMWCKMCFGVFQSDAVCGYMFEGNLVQGVAG